MGRHRRPTAEKRTRNAPPLIGLVAAIGLGFNLGAAPAPGDATPLTITQDALPSPITALDQDRNFAAVFGIQSCDFAGLVDLPDGNSRGNRLLAQAWVAEDPRLGDIRNDYPSSRGSLVIEPFEADVTLVEPAKGDDVRTTPLKAGLHQSGGMTEFEIVVPKRMAPGTRVAIAVGQTVMTIDQDGLADSSYSPRFCYSLVSQADGDWGIDAFDPTYFHPEPALSAPQS